MEYVTDRQTDRHDRVGDAVPLFCRGTALEYNTYIQLSLRCQSIKQDWKYVQQNSVHSRPSLFTCSCFIVLLTCGIIMTTLMHCTVGPLLIQIQTCVDACSNTQEAISAHLSHSVTI